MPTYEYRCKACGAQLEVVQSFKDKPLRRHDECGGELQKIFHARGVVFKGSGFYVTDSRSASKASTPSPSSTSKASTPSPSSTSKASASTSDD
ncbi:MAG: FmdB family zinc ribbon protein [Acidimicrobiia bacterium]|jgi:putative FmdB family regulatory protein